MKSKPEDIVTSRNEDKSKSRFGENEDETKSKFGVSEDGSNSKFGLSEDRSKSKFGESFIQRCASCNYQMHESQIVYMYNDQAFCRHRCRAKVMALDRVQINAATTESEDCSNEITSLSGTEKPKEHIATSRNEDEPKSQLGEIFNRNCALCNYQMHESRVVYMYNDRAFCCHRCRAKVMALDALQTYSDRTEAEVFPKEIISLSNHIS